MLCGALIFLARPYAVVLTHLSSGASGAFSLVEADLTVFPDYWSQEPPKHFFFNKTKKPEDHLESLFTV